MRLEGELDYYMVEELWMKVIDMIEIYGVYYIVLSLENLLFMDSFGLGVILGWYKYVKGLGGEMVVCVILLFVKCLFEMLGLFKIVCLEESEVYVFVTLGVV